MDDISIRTVIIAVNIFVTIIIMSIIIIMFGQMRNIYGIVGTTDTSIYNKFDDIYSMYNGKKVTGIGLLNTIKKYEEESSEDVEIVYPGSKTEDGIKEYSKNSNIREAYILECLMDSRCEDKNKFSILNKEDYKYEDEYAVTVYEEGNKTIINFERINY